MREGDESARVAAVRHVKDRGRRQRGVRLKRVESHCWFQGVKSVLKGILLEQLPSHGAQDGACRYMLPGQANESSLGVLCDENAWPEMAKREGRYFPFLGDWFWLMSKSWQSRGEVCPERAIGHLFQQPANLFIINPSNKRCNCWG